LSGLKSTALFLGNNPQVPLSLLSIGMLGGLCATGVAADLSVPYFAGVGCMWSHTLWQIWTADINDPDNLWKRFNSNKYSGGLLAAAIVAGHF
jgi:4-hydroxybenzoate polyprenyltransferase